MAPIAQQCGDQGRPAGLMARPTAPARVAVKVFMEQDQITPRWIIDVAFLVTMTRPPAGLVGPEEPRQPVSNLERGIAQRSPTARSDRTFHAELVAVVGVITTE